MALAARQFMHLAVIIPTYNEERYLPDTVARIREAGERFQSLSGDNTLEIIVVDNASDDRTAEVAAQLGCLVARETEHNIGNVRNAGAREANGDVLVFVDADTLVPPETLTLIAARMQDPGCIGGAVDVRHEPAKRLIRYYLFVWRMIGLATRMAQGATQFCRREDFVALGGYDERQFMGEDVDFYWRMRRRAKQTSRRVAFIDEVQVRPSPRRFDQWPIWKSLLLTNPLFILLFRRTQGVWTGWYKERPE
jgi:glycosyltransferase involved in cell wall biosynthesis